MMMMMMMKPNLEWRGHAPRPPLAQSRLLLLYHLLLVAFAEAEVVNISRGAAPLKVNFFTHCQAILGANNICNT